MKDLANQITAITEAVGAKDKKVIDAFLDKKKMDGQKLTTDGKRLDGQWMGGRGIAEWKGGKIHFGDLGSKAAQSVEKAVRKAAPKNWLGEGVAAIEEERLAPVAYLRTALVYLGMAAKRGDDEYKMLVNIKDVVDQLALSVSAMSSGSESSRKEIEDAMDRVVDLIKKKKGEFK